MADINITTDGTIAGTKLMVDGKDVTKKQKVVNINLNAYAPFKSSYSNDIYKGGISVSYSTVDEDGKIENKSYGTTETDYVKGIGPKMKQKDSVLQDSVIRYIGCEADTEVCNLVDKIIAHCDEKKLVHPEREKMLSRSLDSLKDKATDLGISLES